MPEPAKIIAFFAYGTLKRRESRENCWPCRPIAVIRATTPGALWQIADYPGMKLADDTRVAGEVWLFPAKQQQRLLSVLDDVEGYPNLFDRTSVTCETLDGQEIVATVYLFNRPIEPAHTSVPPDGNGVVHWTGGSLFTS